MKTKDLNENSENFNGIWVLSSLKKHHFPAHISIRMKKHTIVFTVLVCIFLFGKINVYYQFAYTSQNLYMDCKD